ncbi:hypothetical protein HG530_012592 [Fusarium avenaceum]|nr:hypothetical protein HG530_012592 [Fusarium avenaceum]
MLPDASARIGSPPVYHLKAMAANKAAIATFEQSLAQTKEAVTSAIEKFKENWAGYLTVADELLSTERELAGLKKAVERRHLATKVFEAPPAMV